MVEHIRNNLLKEFQNTVSDKLSNKLINMPPIMIKLKAGPIRPIPDQILEFNRLQKMREMPLSLYEKSWKGKSGLSL